MNFTGLLDSFQGVRGLVVGDLMLDEYIMGRATRISPEAPVMVVRQTSVKRVPGGAANVAMNVLALGASCHLVGLVGRDQDGDYLEQALSETGLSKVGLVRDPARVTTRKTRVLADSAHQVLRIDNEDSRDAVESVESEIVKQALAALENSDFVILSDYLKGSLTQRVCSEVLVAARQKGIPICANPKPESISKYRGATLVSLNRAEASSLFSRNQADPKDIGTWAKAAKEIIGAKSVLVTLGEDGMVASGETEIRVNAPKVAVFDTAGAGDTVIATVALGLTTSGFKQEVFELAAQTAAAVVRKVGVATPDKQDLADIRLS